MAQVLSTLPSVGPALPENCTNVKVRTSKADPSASNNKLDVTILSDTQRWYATAPLVDPGPGGDDEGITQTVVASFFGVAPEPDGPGATGWVCTEVETEYAVGEFVKGTATYVYKEAEE